MPEKLLLSRALALVVDIDSNNWKRERERKKETWSKQKHAFQLQFQNRLQNFQLNEQNWLFCTIEAEDVLLSIVDLQSIHGCQVVEPDKAQSQIIIVDQPYTEKRQKQESSTH